MTRSNAEITRRFVLNKHVHAKALKIKPLSVERMFPSNFIIKATSFVEKLEESFSHEIKNKISTK